MRTLESSAREISLPYVIFFQSLGSTSFNAGINDYFFRIEHFLHLHSDRHDLETALKFRELCLDEGRDFYSEGFVEYLEELSDEGWERIFELASDYEIEKSRGVSLGMSPEEVEEDKKYLASIRHIRDSMDLNYN